MKRPFPTILLLFTLFAAFCLSGCGASNQHAKAVQSAVVNYSDYYIEVNNLFEQVKEQYKQLDKQQPAIDYTITINIPDYSKIDLSQIDFVAPALDYATMSASQYQAAAVYSLRKSLEKYAYANTLPSYIQLPVVFSMHEDDGDFSATLTGTSRNTIQKTADAMVEPLLDSFDSYTQNDRLATVADARFRLLDELFGEDYIAQSGVQKVTGNGDGTYELTLVYPDPYDVYAALAQQYYASFNQPFYGDAVTVSLSTDGITTIDTASMATSTNRLTIALDEANGTCTLVNASIIESQLSAARMQSETAAAQRINEEWRVPEVDVPSSGTVLEGKSSGNDIVFVTSKDLGAYYYVRFYLLPGDDANEEGTFTAGMFIVGGKKATIHLPSGYYRVSCYIGDSWYGLDALFGPDATSFDSSNAIRSRSGYINTISFE